MPIAVALTVAWDGFIGDFLIVCEITPTRSSLVSSHRAVWDINENGFIYILKNEVSKNRRIICKNGHGSKPRTIIECTITYCNNRLRNE